MNVRAKFYCTGFCESTYSPGARVFSFMPVYDDQTPENARYAKLTPTGSLTLTVDNPEVDFEVSKYYYLDFTPAE